MTILHTIRNLLFLITGAKPKKGRGLKNQILSTLSIWESLGIFFGASRVPVGHFPGGFGFLQILPNFGQFCFRFGYTIR